MIFLALWVRWLGRPSAIRAAWLGLLCGIAVFEKLSSIVLLVPLALFLGSDRPRRMLRFVPAAIAGFLIGALPVVVVNLQWLVTQRRLFSLGGAGPPAQTLREYVVGYFSLGAGAGTIQFLLDHLTPPWLTSTEGILTVFGLLAALGLMMSGPTTSLAALLFRHAASSYVLIAVALRCLPAGTAEHHWILGTPFQYLALSLASGGLPRSASTSKGPDDRRCCDPRSPAGRAPHPVLFGVRVDP